MWSWDGPRIAMDQMWHFLYIYYLVYEEFDEIRYVIFFIIFREWSYMYKNRHVWSIAPHPPVFPTSHVSYYEQARELYVHDVDGYSMAILLDHSSSATL